MREYHDLSDSEIKEAKSTNRRQTKDIDSTESSEQLLPGIDTIDDALTSLTSDSNDVNDSGHRTDNLTLLTELGLADANATVDNDFGEFQNGLMDNFGTKNNASDVDDVFDKLLSDFNVGK